MQQRQQTLTPIDQPTLSPHPTCQQRISQISHRILFILVWIMRAGLTIGVVVFFAQNAYIPFLITLILAAIAFALVRSRLLNFPLFLNRSLVYTLLSLSFAIFYFVVIGTYQIIHDATKNSYGGVYAAQGRDLADIVSTLFMVALFNPFRQRIQQFIDHRFYRHNYDAEQVISTFTSTIREEINLDQLNNLLLSTIHTTLLPTSLELWLREIDTDNKPDTTLRLLPWQPAEEKPTSTTGLLTEKELTASSQRVIEVALDDPLLKILLAQTDIIELQSFHHDSPLGQALFDINTCITLPLISRGQLVGLLNLGSRLSGQKYEPYDQRLLIMLAAQAAPAVRVAELVLEQQNQALENERIEQELRTAQFIQLTLLPKEVPNLPGWHLAAYYQPAREVGGDFYDFHPLTDGRLGITIGDVTGKGIPAALFMTTTCTMLRSVAKELNTPGEILAHVNELLHANIPPGMFVTCFYGILDPSCGQLRYANAGHDLPYRHSIGHVDEVFATGMPLGLFPGMLYEEQTLTITPDETLLFYSDGLVEAHNSAREMFGIPRLTHLLSQDTRWTSLIDFLLENLKAFTSQENDQEDDVTLVTLHRSSSSSTQEQELSTMPTLLAEWSLASIPGNERQAMEHVISIVRPLHLPEAQLANLGTAVAEAIMNAMEHGNQYEPEKMVTIQVLTTHRALLIRIHDEGPEKLPLIDSTPDLSAKLAGEQTPRGWGLFLIKHLVDELHTHSEPPGYIELVLYLPTP
jgi:serine phosphatase RsbU (regulator of sigma subunit)/anti-sigma regulatory factor (Ser/Thr protein kinase)